MEAPREEEVECTCVYDKETGVLKLCPACTEDYLKHKGK